MHVRCSKQHVITFAETLDERLLQALCILSYYATLAAEHCIIKQGNKKRLQKVPEESHTLTPDITSSPGSWKSIICAKQITKLFFKKHSVEGKKQRSVVKYITHRDQQVQSKNTCKH